MIYYTYWIYSQLINVTRNFDCNYYFFLFFITCYLLLRNIIIYKYKIWNER